MEPYESKLLSMVTKNKNIVSVKMIEEITICVGLHAAKTPVSKNMHRSNSLAIRAINTQVIESIII